MARQTLSFVTGTGTIQVANMLQASLAMNIKAILDADAAIEAAKEKRAKAVEAINSTHGRGKHTVPGFGEVVISANNSYDAKAMTEALKPGQFRLVSERRIVSSLVAKKYPEVHAAAKREHGVKASVTSYQS